MRTNNIKQPSWVSALQTSLDAMQAKLENAQHNMDAKLDRIGSQMEEHLRGVREEMGQLREYMDKHGEDMKQALDSFREETNRNFETAEAEMRAQKKDIEILEERTAGVEEWSTDVQDIITASLEQQTKLQDKLSDIEGRSRRNNVRIWGLKEGIEGDSVSEYVNRLIHKELGMSEDIKLEIQRAHRALALNPQPDKFPRAIIVNFLRFEVKENVIKTAWRTCAGRGEGDAAERLAGAGLERRETYAAAETGGSAQVDQTSETRAGRRERGDNNETRVREDRHRIGGADE
ncbi:Cytotoxicity-associated immunodominant antigen [Dissostichus eleginoides]|uniref:Cytotoxicity-associated immunodominant antigen n=1 Tax=Dissostichus eleginoides TaxID=100907 RepID=A0AAD9FC50_DISEL|nr:Cytotoxicity-associated immunodominant antigen [Dissostichus eleginoides]